MIMNKTLGARIRYAREMRQMTRDGLVTRMKEIDPDNALSVSSLSRLEGNKSYSRKEGTPPTLNSASLAVLATALKTTPDFILAFSDQLKPVDLTHGDADLNYLLTLVERMNSEQRRRLTEYASFIASDAHDVMKLKSRFQNLYLLASNPKPDGTIDRGDQRFLDAAELAADFVITAALRSEEECNEKKRK